MSTLLVIQHAADDPPSRLGRWLAERGCGLDVRRCHLGEPLPPTLAGYAGVVVLGGAMGAHDDATVPWLPHTKDLLREAVDQDLPTLGICLGHQLLAVAHQGLLATDAVQQVGLHRLRLTAAAAADPLFASLAEGASAVHWNNDLVVAPPPGAVVLSESEAGLQAFRLGSRIWGLQFHPEVDVETVARWAASDVADGRLPAARADGKITAIREADDELVRSWRGFSHRFADVVLG